LRGAGAIQPSVMNPGTPSKSDVLGQKGFVGWKTYFVCVVLNQAWMARIEVGATDLNGVS
jgi:N4-gp56 family major capsid protein